MIQQLPRCARVLPTHGDGGGFFVARFRKLRNRPNVFKAQATDVVPVVVHAASESGSDSNGTGNHADKAIPRLGAGSVARRLLGPTYSLPQPHDPSSWPSPLRQLVDVFGLQPTVEGAQKHGVARFAVERCIVNDIGQLVMASEALLRLVVRGRRMVRTVRAGVVEAGVVLVPVPRSRPPMSALAHSSDSLPKQPAEPLFDTSVGPPSELSEASSTVQLKVLQEAAHELGCAATKRLLRVSLHNIVRLLESAEHCIAASDIGVDEDLVDGPVLLSVRLPSNGSVVLVGSSSTAGSAACNCATQISLSVGARLGKSAKQLLAFNCATTSTGTSTSRSMDGN